MELDVEYIREIANSMFQASQEAGEEGIMPSFVESWAMSILDQIRMAEQNDTHIDQDAL